MADAHDADGELLSRDEIWFTLRVLIANVVGVDKGMIQLETRFVEDLGFQYVEELANPLPLADLLVSCLGIYLW